MKLTLIILLLTGVSTLALNLRSDLEMMLLKGSDLAARDLKGGSNSKKSNCDCDSNQRCEKVDGEYECVDKTPKSARKNSSRCGSCSSGEVCRRNGSDYTCVTKKTPKSRDASGSDSSSGSSTSSDSTSSSEGNRCAARVRSIAVVVKDGEDVKSCAKRLRSNDSMTRYLNKNFHPKRIEDFEVIRVGDCSSRRVKNKLKELESNRGRNTNDKVKTVFVVVSKDDFSKDCRHAIKKLPDKIEKDLRCRQIRRMDDDQTDSDDNFIIRVKSESQCTKSKLERKVLNAADLN